MVRRSDIQSPSHRFAARSTTLVGHHPVTYFFVPVGQSTLAIAEWFIRTRPMGTSESARIQRPAAAAQPRVVIGYSDRQ